MQISDRAAAAFKPYNDLRMKADHVVARSGYTIRSPESKRRSSLQQAPCRASPLPGAGQPNPLCAGTSAAK
jgi:hypothetical protein